MIPPLAVADTSFFVASERVELETRAGALGVSMVTIGELKLGVLAARTDRALSRRLDSLLAAEALEPFPVDRAVSDAWAALASVMRSAGRPMPGNDSWIAATAIAHGLPLIALDGDYDHVPGLDLIRL